MLLFRCRAIAANRPACALSFVGGARTSTSRAVCGRRWLFGRWRVPQAGHHIWRWRVLEEQQRLQYSQILLHEFAVHDLEFYYRYMIVFYTQLFHSRCIERHWFRVKFPCAISFLSFTCQAFPGLADLLLSCRPYTYP